MKNIRIRLIITLVVLVLVNIALGAWFSNDIKILESNKDKIRLKNITNEETVYSIEDDKIILLISTTCESCIEEMQWLSTQTKEKQKKVDIISISSLDETKKLIERLNIKSDVYIDFDKDFAIKYEIYATPVIYTVDEGKLNKENSMLEEIFKNE